MQCFSLEIISKGEIAEHLKESTVTRGLADVVDITGTDALLAGRNAAARRDLLSCKIGFQRCHARIDQQKAVVVFRHP